MISGGAVPLDYAVHEFAKSCGKWPWEIWDQPTDAVMRALEMESVAARAQAFRQRTSSG